MKKTIFTILTLVTGAAAALAEAPNLFTYQGRLKEGGQAITGNRTVELFLCDAETAGTCHTTGAQGVAVSNGLFRSTFSVPGTVDFGTGAWWLELKVGADTLAPRERLTSNAYALFSATAAYAENIAAAAGAEAVVISSNVYVTGYSSAAVYYGDGSQLTGIVASGGVLKAGDTMTGQLTLAGSTLTVTGDAFSVGGATLAVKSGMVGIGKDNPTSPLDVAQADAAGDGLAVTIAGNTSGRRALHVAADNGATVALSVRGNGRVGLGTEAPQSRLDVVSGSISVRGTGAALVLSDSSRTIFPETEASLGGGIKISTNVYVVGFSSAARYYGDGSGLTGIAGDNLGDHTAAAPLNMNNYAILSSSDITAARYQISGSTVLALPGSVTSVGVGPDAGRLNTAVSNVFVGYQAGYANTTGNQNNFVGQRAGYSNTTGGNNTMLGNTAGYANTTGMENSYFGDNAGYSNTSGSRNVALGASAGTGAAAAYSSATIAGYGAGSGLTTGYGNTLLGLQAGDSLQTGSRNIIIGYDADATAPTISDELNIGGLIWGRLADGLVGIGAASTLPQAALDVRSTGTAANVYAQIWRDSAGAAVASVTAQGYFYGDGSGLAGVTAAAIPAGITISTIGATASTPYGGVKIATNTYVEGKLGIGTVQPTSALHIDDPAGILSVQTHAISAGQTAVIRFKISDVGTSDYSYSGIVAERRGDGYHDLHLAVKDSAPAVTAADAKLTITRYGSVGIGTNAPASKLTVKDGDLRISTTSGSYGIRFQDGSLQTTASVPDNLGTHVATTTLDMAGFQLVNVTTIAATATGVHISTGGTGSIISTDGLYINPGKGMYFTGQGNNLTAGNARGTGAVELQTYRSSLSQVASGIYATVPGGANNTASGPYSFAVGEGNSASAYGASVSGGYSNQASQTAANVSGGLSNAATGWGAAIAGGRGNTASGESSFIGGGGMDGSGEPAAGNTAYGKFAVVAGGGNNVATSSNSFIGGGLYNIQAGTSAVIAGGERNEAYTFHAFVGGGYYNRVGSDGTGGNAAFIGGGNGSRVDNNYGAVAGGFNNVIDTAGDYAFIGGGSSNSVTGAYAAVPGGLLNEALLPYSFAAGRRARSSAAGAFTWGDSEGTLIDNNAPDRTWFKNRGGFLVTGSTQPITDGGFFVSGNGNVGVGTINPGEALEVNGGVRLNTTSAKPPCNVDNRGTIWLLQGAAGVGDTIEVCAKNGADTYSWYSLAAIP